MYNNYKILTYFLSKQGSTTMIITCLLLFNKDKDFYHYKFTHCCTESLLCKYTVTWAFIKGQCQMFLPDICHDTLQKKGHLSVNSSCHQNWIPKVKVIVSIYQTKINISPYKINKFKKNKKYISLHCSCTAMHFV